jgi:phage-related protein
LGLRWSASRAGQDAGKREAPGRYCTIAPGVLEIVSDFRGDTFRAVYTVKFPKAVYVLHVFQKKSKRGIATPRHEMKHVEKRLAQVVELEKLSRKNLG